MVQQGHGMQGVGWPVGTVLGEKYRVERALGHGGMGAVLLVRHVRLGELRALKLMRPDLAQNPASRERFLREAKAAARLRSEHVARVHDVGELPEGMPYIEMEYLEGEDLAAVVARLGPQQAGYVVGWMLEACEALAEAHAAGIVHRDLKPANLFLARGVGDRVLLKVLDFGIARITAPESHQLTAADSTVGSPLYMAPEQLRSAVNTDARSDIWSLGVTMFELLTGRPPFLADTVPALTLVISEQLPPPLRSFSPSTPASIEALVLRCLEKAPERRFQSVHELMQALSLVRAELSGASLPAISSPQRPMSSPGLAFTEAEPSASSSLATSAGSSPGLTIADNTKGSARPTRRPVALWLALAGLVVALGSAGGLGAASMGYLEPLGINGFRKPSVGLAAIEALRQPRGSEGQLVNSEPYWQAAMNDFSVAAARTGAPVRYAAGEQLAAGYLALLRGNFGNAERSLRAAATLDPRWALPHFCLALTLSRQKEMRRAIAEAQLTERLEPEWFGGAWATARVHARLGTSENAIQEYRRALTKAPNNAVLLSELALVYHNARIDAEADRYGQKALELDPDLPAIHVMYAERALERNDGNTALREAGRALSVNPTNPAAKLAEADALALLGREAEARAAYEKAIFFWKQEGSEDTSGRFAGVEQTLKAGQLPRKANPPGRPPRTTTSPGAVPPVTSPSTIPTRTKISPGGSKAAPGNHAGCAPNDPLCAL